MGSLKSVISGIDRNFMKKAIELAKEAGKSGEIPVGAVIEKDGKIIAAGRNRREQIKNTLAHAEIEAISAACEVLGDWRLDGCTIYVTLEPCPMCAGAILNSRISRVVFGAFDRRWGSIESVVDLCRYPFESRPEIYAGICEDECSALLSGFFEDVRKGGKGQNKGNI